VVRHRASIDLAASVATVPHNPAANTPPRQACPKETVEEGVQGRGALGALARHPACDHSTPCGTDLHGVNGM
jgi:hypothetical protein